MKYSAKDIARALADMAGETHLSTHVDDALRLLREHNPGRSVRSFPTLVERALRRAGKEVSATLVTPTGDAGATASHIQKTLQDILKKEVHLTQTAEPEMIGGAVLMVGDELYDLSIPGALENLSEYLQNSAYLQSK